MIAGRWGKPSEVLLDLAVEADGTVRGVVNPGRHDAPIREGRFRTWQWEQVFAQETRRDFVLVLKDQHGRLIGFAAGRPDEEDFAGQLSKIYLRWEYHGLGLGRRMMAEAARRFLERGMESCILFADLGNPTLGFSDHLGGRRLPDDRGHFSGTYGWDDVRTLLR